MHHRNRAADRKDRNRRIEPELAGAALGGPRHSDEGANLEATLPCLPPDFLVAIGQQGLAAVRHPLPEKLPIPTLIDAPGVRSRRPMGDPSGADHGDPLRTGIACAPERPPEFVTSLEG